MIDLHRAIIVTGIFFLMPLLTFLLLVSSILSLLEGDKSAFIGIAIALLFMSIDAGAISRYLRYTNESVEGRHRPPGNFPNFSFLFHFKFCCRSERGRHHIFCDICFFSYCRCLILLSEEENHWIIRWWDTISSISLYLPWK